MKISIIGLGFVGSAILNSLNKKDMDLEIITYDKFKNGGIGKIDDCFDSELIFLCLPTPYINKDVAYDLNPINENLRILNNNKFKGLIIIKSTVLPGTTNNLCDKYENLNICHNPEFLTARTAEEDFLNQKHIILGKSKRCNNFDIIYNFYKKYWSKSKISLCNSNESEAVKLSCNCFYSVKIQFFNELYLMCKKNDIDYEKMKNIMLENDWINRMHTDVPGHDGKLSYGGMCFPKDTNALLSFLDSQSLPSEVLRSVINERNIMREDGI